jgi:hypothetical protein
VITTTNETTEAKRLIVRHEPVDGSPPWRAVIVDRGTVIDHGNGLTEWASTPVGRFATHAEAVRAGCSALRFVAAGIPWRVQA